MRHRDGRLNQEYEIVQSTRKPHTALARASLRADALYAHSPGLQLRKHDETWAREKAARAAQFFATDLAAHFKAEEEALFPAMRDFSGASALLSELLTEHRMLEALAERLRGTEVAKLVDALGEFADLLEAHIRKEERELFPLHEKQMSPEMTAQVGREVNDIIGDAMQPRNPELLK